MPSDFNLKVIEEFRANGGKVGGRYANRGVLLLTNTGAKSGRTYTTPMVYTRDGDRIVVIASHGGAPHNPDWYHNLVAHPDAIVELGTERFAVRATVTTGVERRRLFDNQAREMPHFAEYEKMTSREIPVIALTRIG